MAFPTTSVLDSFTGTNGTDLPVYSANWVSAPTGGQNLEIQGNAATGTGAPANNINGWTTTFGPASEVYCTISTKPGNNEIVLILARLVQETSLTTVDGYCLRFQVLTGTDTLTIQRFDNGVQTSLGASISQEVSAGDAIGLYIAGSTLQAYYKASGGSWGQAGTDRTDSTHSAAGKIALFSSGTTVRIDEFGGGSAAQALTPSLVTNTQTFHAATVSPGAVSLAPSLVTNSQTFYSPTVNLSSGTQGLAASLVTNSQTFYGPTVSSSYTLLPSLVTNTQTFYGETVSAQYVIRPSVVTNTQTFYAPVVSVGTVTLSPSLVTNEQTFHSPTVLQQSNQELLPSLLTNEQTFFAAVISFPGQQQSGAGGGGGGRKQRTKRLFVVEINGIEYRVPEDDLPEFLAAQEQKVEQAEKPIKRHGRKAKPAPAKPLEIVVKSAPPEMRPVIEDEIAKTNERIRTILQAAMIRYQELEEEDELIWLMVA